MASGYIPPGERMLRPETVRALAEAGKLPFTRDGYMRRYREADVRALAARRDGPPRPAGRVTAAELARAQERVRRRAAAS